MAFVALRPIHPGVIAQQPSEGEKDPEVWRDLTVLVSGPVYTELSPHSWQIKGERGETPV